MRGKGKSKENEMKADGKASDFDSDLTLAGKRSLDNSIKKQKKFMDGEITKKKLSKKDSAALNAIEESGAS